MRIADDKVRTQGLHASTQARCKCARLCTDACARVHARVVRSGCACMRACACVRACACAGVCSSESSCALVYASVSVHACIFMCSSPPPPCPGPARWRRRAAKRRAVHNQQPGTPPVCLGPAWWLRRAAKFTISCPARRLRSGPGPAARVAAASGEAKSSSHPAAQPAACVPGPCLEAAASCESRSSSHPAAQPTAFVPGPGPVAAAMRQEELSLLELRVHIKTISRYGYCCI